MWHSFRPYVSVAKRRAKAARDVASRRKRGETITPVEIQGRNIANTFWGKSWCDNLESYSDYSNRLPRGRTYVRNGSVVNLRIQSGKVIALVSGSELYSVEIDIDKLERKVWSSVKTQCANQIGSVVELLQGKLSKHVMEVVTRRPDGLFPKPSQIKLKCSCPDWATMCKHVSAVLYGVGARLDTQPELLFHLRQVDHFELIQNVGDPSKLGTQSAAPTLVEGDLAEVFGIELADSNAEIVPNKVEELESKRTPRKRTVAAPAKATSAGMKKLAASRSALAVTKPPIKRRRTSTAVR